VAVGYIIGSEAVISVLCLLLWFGEGFCVKAKQAAELYVGVPLELSSWSMWSIHEYLEISGSVTLLPFMYTFFVLEHVELDVIFQ